MGCWHVTLNDEAAALGASWVAPCFEVEGVKFINFYWIGVVVFLF